MVVVTPAFLSGISLNERTYGVNVVLNSTLSHGINFSSDMLVLYVTPTAICWTT